MTAIIILARIVAIAASGVLLWSISNGTIETTKATGADALAIYALAGAVFVTAGVVGIAWSAKRYGLAIFLISCLFAGEGYNFLKTAEREVSGREAAQSAANTALEARETLAENVAKAETAWASARDAVSANASKKDCVKNCREMLLSTVDSTAGELALARQRLAEATVPASATPLADRSGFQAWMIDLLAAALKSLAMNGLAAGLVAFGTHGVTAPGRKEAKAATVDLPRIVVSDERAPMAMAAANDGGQSDFGAVSEFELAKVAALFRGDLEPDGPNGGNVIRPKRFTREEVRADLTARIERGEAWPSQRALAAQFGIPTTTLHDWLRLWASEGNGLPRQQIGRRKMVG